MSKQVIVCAAIKTGDVILCGHRHFDMVMISQIEAIGLTAQDLAGNIQGFIDNKGKFLTRQQAMDIVKKNGQPFDAERNGGNGKKLFSEGLY